MFRAARNPRARCLLLTGALAATAAALPATADASSVELSVTPSSDGYQPNVTTVSYRAAPGEANRVEVSVDSSAVTRYRLKFVDQGAPLSAGAGCEGGGGGGSPAFCWMEAPRGPEMEVRGKLFITKPGTEWAADLRIELDDLDDSFDSSALAPISNNSLPVVERAGPVGVNVTGGAGDDSIVTGPGADRVAGQTGSDTIETGAGTDEIDPGPGADIVRAAGDADKVDAGPVPDESDYFELGQSNFDSVSYAARTDPVIMAAGVAGAPGEGDVLVGADTVIGGSGDDRLAGAEQAQVLVGEAGDDILIGSPQDDRLVGRDGNDLLRGLAGNDELDGGAGDDRSEAGEGDDKIEEVVFPPLPPSDADVAAGEGGDDVIMLAGDDDRADGGPGLDSVFGEGGNDEVSGGEGDDSVVGGAGADRLSGGPGRDQLYASRVRELMEGPSRRTPIDTAADLVDCGEDEDSAVANAWDSVVACEHVKLVKAVQIGTPHRVGRRNRWVLLVGAAGTGRLVVRGQGLRRASYAIPANASDQERTMKVSLRLRPGARRRLLHRGRLILRVTVDLITTEGVPRSASRRVVLKSAR